MGYRRLAYPECSKIARKESVVDGQTEYRVGSPFAEEPVVRSSDNTPVAAVGQSALAGTAMPSDPYINPESLGDGVWGQTCESAVLASLLLTPFGLIGFTLFPAGGAAIAALGLAVSLLALASVRVKLTRFLLAIHSVLFVLCYLQSI